MAAVTGDAPAESTDVPATSTDAPPSHRGGRAAPQEAIRERQLPLLVRASHPRQALLFGIGVVVAASFAGLDLKQALIAGLAVFVVQLIAGLMNDVSDAERDRLVERPRKPVADGRVPKGNATFIATVLFLLAVPLSLQSGVRAGICLLATLVVALVHNRALGRTPFSFVGWMVTVPLIAAFIAWADRGNDLGSAPTVPMLAVAAVLGLCLHLTTSLRDLPFDHRAGIRPLPLVIALRTGAPALMWATIALTVLTCVAIVMVALGPGLHR